MTERDPRNGAIDFIRRIRARDLDTRGRQTIPMTKSSADAGGPGTETTGSTRSAGWVTPAEELVACTAGMRGAIRIIRAEDGIADHSYMCQKLDDDTYDWVQLDGGGSSGGGSVGGYYRQPTWAPDGSGGWDWVTVTIDGQTRPVFALAALEDV